MKILLCGASAVALMSGVTAPAFAADMAGSGPPAAAPEIIVTGTRLVGVKAADSAAPIQIVGGSALKEVGQPDLTQALAQNLPSYNAQATGGDTANLTLSAALRGLSANDTLVLVNGKRRHGTANLAVDGSNPYQGSASTDLSFVPVGAIDHIEVLQDGAAAQYGTDAIAGVINIILKHSDHSGTLSATGGEYYRGDGGTGAWSGSKGFSLGDKGFVDFTVEGRYHGFSQRGGADYRYYSPSGALAPGLSPVDAAGVPKSPNAPDVNKTDGDALYNVYNFFYNAGYNLTDNIQAYSFGSYGYRYAASYQNYRGPSAISGTTSTGATVYPFPHGFDPKETLHENDFSITGGAKGDISEWNWDLSGTYGQDKDQINTVDSVNADLFSDLQSLSATPVSPQRSFYDGGFTNTELTGNLDIDRAFKVGLASPVNLAFGAEVRRNSFSIDHGDAASLYGAGATAFPGFALTDAGSHSRTNYAGYIDVAADPIKDLKIDLAGRFEHYSDFGDATVGKLTARYDFSPAFAVRGTISNGFRAPTLAEEYYSATNVTPNSAVVQLPADAAAAKLAGFAPLKAEKSTNYSIGFVAHPIEHLQINADAYMIDIKGRIVGSGYLFGSLGPTVVSQGVLDAIRANGNVLGQNLDYTAISTFTNGADTRTKGVEVSANYASDFNFGHIDWTLGFNYNENKITKLAKLPAAVTVAAIGQTAILSPTAISTLTTATPGEKAILGALYTHQKWSVNVRTTIYGPSSEIVSTDGSGVNGYKETIGVTAIADLDIGYKITNNLKLDLGANNLFNTEPPSVKNIATNKGGLFRPIDSSNVMGAPLSFSPWGIDGGYYYGRVTYNF